MIITGNNTSGIVLSVPGRQDPATLVGGAYIGNVTTAHNGDAVYGTTATAWDFVNFGRINAVGNDSDGIDLRNGGAVENAAATATISGYVNGVYVTGSTGTVSNLGTIAATGTAGIGIDLRAGGRVINRGLIDAAGDRYPTGVYLAAGGFIDNVGTVQADGGSDGAAVDMVQGGTLINEVGGLLQASADAVVVAGTAGGGGGGGNANGVMIAGGIDGSGNIINGGMIAGGIDGVVLKATGDSLLNSGVINGTASYGVYLTSGGSATNAASGLIEGGNDGVLGTHSAAFVLNRGTIAATGAGGIGVGLAAAGSTLTNSGTIGGAGDAVVLAGADSLLVVDPGAVFAGAVAASAAGDVLELAAGASTGVIGGLGTAVAGFGLVTVDAAAAWRVNGSSTLSAGTTLSDGGSLTFAGSLANQGAIELAAGARLTLANGDSGSGLIDFAAGALLAVDGTAMPTNTISAFAPGDTIDLRAVAGGAGDGLSLSANNVLTVSAGGHSYALDFDPSQNFLEYTFFVEGDGAGGTDIILSAGIIVGSGRTYVVSAGETLSGIIVRSGGTLEVASGGTVSDTQIQGGGLEIVEALGTDVSATVLSRGSEDVFGTASATLIVGGGTQTVEPGGAARGVVLDGRGVQIVSGTASGTVVSSGDEQIVISGGLAIDTIVSSGGRQIMSASGVASGTLVYSGGLEFVSASGMANGSVLSSGGGELVLRGGSDIGAVLSGGTQQDFGSATDVVISRGGRQVVGSGGAESGTLITDGGMLELQSGSRESGPIDFAGVGGLLLIDGPRMPTVPISGFLPGDTIDLRGLRFTSAISASFDAATSTLLVTSGGTVVDRLTISGIAPIVSGTRFAVAHDAFGGTSISELTSAGYLGNDLTFQYYYNGGPYDAGGSPKTFTATTGSDVVFDGGGSNESFTISFSRSQIIYQYLSSVTWNPSGTSLDENGLFISNGSLITSLSSVIPNIRGVELDPSSVGLGAFNASDVTFDGRDVAVSWANLTFQAGARVVLDVQFGSPGIPPIPSQLALSPNSESGTPGSDDTRDTTPVITGLGEAGDTVTLFVGDAVIGSGRVRADGTWSIRTTALAQGVYDIVAIEANRLGTQSRDSSGLSLRIDTTPPRTTPASLTVGSGSPATAIDIAAPTDASPFTITVTALPEEGTVTLAGGATAVTVGEQLTVAQLTGLDYTPDADDGGSSGTFKYTVTDEAGNHSTGVAILNVAAVHLFDFVFTYDHSGDYYEGVVADDGTFGYRVGQSIAGADGHYQIFAQGGTTSEIAGTVSVDYYFHNGPGEASTMPILTGEGLPDGTGGLGSENDSVAGTNGQDYQFSSASPAAFKATAQYGFVYSYANGQEYYAGTVADDGTFGLTAGELAAGGGTITRTITNGSGVVLGTYTIFADGMTTRAAGTVFIDSFTDGAASYTPNDAGTAAGVKGLGSEAGSLTIAGTTFSFSDSHEPVLPPNAVVAASQGNEALSAQPGIATQFDFNNVSFGNDAITGFDPSIDAIQLPQSLAASFPAVVNDISSAQGGTLITFNAHQSIELSGVASSSLSALNFRFV